MRRFRVGWGVVWQTLGVGAIAYALTFGATWLIGVLLGATGGTDGVLAGMLGGSWASGAVAAAAAHGSPVDWWLPGLGAGGRISPVALLMSGSRLVVLGLGPVLGTLSLGVLIGRSRRTDRVGLLAGSAVTYALLQTVGAVIGGHVPQAATQLSTSAPLVFVLCLMWAAGLGWAGLRIADTTLLTYRRLTALAAAVATAAVMMLAGSIAPRPSSPSADSADGVTIEPAPVGYERQGVRTAIDEIKRASGSNFLSTMDPWRGVPSMLSMRSPASKDVDGWLREHAGLFAVDEPLRQLTPLRTTEDRSGRHFWFEQAIDGVPVYGARVGVHTDQSGRFVQTLSNGMLPDVTANATRATLAQDKAIAVAVRAMPSGQVVGAPQLLLVPEDPHPDRATEATLAWRVVVANHQRGGDGAMAYFVDATSRGTIFRADELDHEAKNRRIYDYQNELIDPNLNPPARAEGGLPTGVADVDNAYTFAGNYYDFLHDVFGRDSYDGNGGTLEIGVRFVQQEDTPFPNAFWYDEGGSAVFGDGMVTRDIVGHELTHGLVARTAGLLYRGMQGALNESFADIFGESLEAHVLGEPNWLIGTGSVLGTFRSFADPPAYGQPDHTSDYHKICADSGGVHTNSGIPNKAYYVLAQRIGIAKAQQIAFRALTVYLDPSSGFNDTRAAELQAAWDLYGKDSQESSEVWRAWGSVGVDGIAVVAGYWCSICFAEASLHGEGLSGLDPTGWDLAGISAALLRARDLLVHGDTPAFAHYNLVYAGANEDAIRLLTSDVQLQKKTAHAMQSLAPFLDAVGTTQGRQVTVTQTLVNELDALIDAYVLAGQTEGAPGLAALLTSERARVNTQAMVGMTADQALIYLDQTFAAGSGSRLPGSTGSATVDAPVQHDLSRTGRADVLVLLRDKADLSGTDRYGKRADRTAYVYRQLVTGAKRSQEGLRSLLARRGASFEQFWIVNAVKVTDADASLIAELSARGEVARIRKAGAALIEQVTPGQVEAAVDGVEWGVDRIRAPKVWSDYGVRGEGIVVASIDTGVQFDHPALVNTYRGKQASGGYNHNYNWFDPSQICSTVAPCDNNNHGTHTLGTIVGAGGIGVAPVASWISAKGCEAGSCSDVALLRSGQWMIAPTDLNGQNPRPELAPHVISNSWGGAGGDDFYAAIVNSWVQAGIMPVFANGNEGPGCNTAASPGDYPNTYAAGAFDSGDNIAYFSGRGSSAFGDENKPNLAAPGVNVRSAIPGGQYAAYSGTSMAAPHVTGSIALLWSAAPSLIGNIAATRQLLDDTAVDVFDGSCGGTTDDNNVWGEGRLDAYSTVAFAPRAALTTLMGTVVDSRGRPVADVTVAGVTGGGGRRSTITDASGSYSITLPAGTYQVTAEGFGYRTYTTTVTVNAQTTVRQDIALTSAPRYRVLGQLIHNGVPVPFAAVKLDGAPLPTVRTGQDGSFALADVPIGTYTLVSDAARCTAATAQTITVDWDEILTITAADRKDDFGYECVPGFDAFPQTSTVLPLTGDDASVAVALPFPASLYGYSYSTAYVSTNGSINFDRLNPMSINQQLPSTAGPNAAIYPFWDDLLIDGQASVRSGSSGAAPNRVFAVEWRNAALRSDPSQRVTFAVTMTEKGRISFHYGQLTGGAMAHGGSATVGIEDQLGEVAFQYSTDEPVLHTGLSIQFHGLGLIRGTAVDGWGNPIPYVGVAIENLGTISTNYIGHFGAAMAPGSYLVSFTHPDFQTVFKIATIGAEGDVVTVDATMPRKANTITGVVVDENGAPVPGITVTASQQQEKVIAITDSTGHYRMTNVGPGPTSFVAAQPCLFSDMWPSTINVIRDTTVDLRANRIHDDTGLACYSVPLQPATAGTQLALTGDDAAIQVTLPFTFPFYGTNYTSGWVSTNGLVDFKQSFASPPTSDHRWLPDLWNPDASIYAYWDDLAVDSSSSVWTGTTADSGFLVEWRNVLIKRINKRATFQAILYASGKIRLQFVDLPNDPTAYGAYAGVGIESDSPPPWFPMPHGMTPVWRNSVSGSLQPSLHSNDAIEFRAAT